eukprot:TRINITY_DN20386_c0_g1_i1.p1 TRINITY_DN20386_c0_g1~~TRINITY_DN20386_c0_g1_i1.p1  ORF type:complete len:769 (+),score=249.18 TRINITY_DN20386_c0_g1_i1:91-2397(+)
MEKSKQTIDDEDGFCEEDFEEIDFASLRGAFGSASGVTDSFKEDLGTDREQITRDGGTGVNESPLPVEEESAYEIQDQQQRQQQQPRHVRSEHVEKWFFEQEKTGKAGKDFSLPSSVAMKGVDVLEGLEEDPIVLGGKIVMSSDVRRLREQLSHALCLLDVSRERLKRVGKAADVAPQDDFEVENVALSSEIRRLNAQLTPLQIRSERLRHQCEAQESDLHEKEEQIYLLKEERSSLAHKVDQLMEAAEKVHSLEKIVQEKDDLIRSLHVSLDHANARVSHLEEGVTSDRMEKYEKALEAIRKEYENRLDVMQAEVDEATMMEKDERKGLQSSAMVSVGVQTYVCVDDTNSSSQDGSSRELDVNGEEIRKVNDDLMETLASVREERDDAERRLQILEELHDSTAHAMHAQYDDAFRRLVGAMENEFEAERLSIEADLRSLREENRQLLSQNFSLRQDLFSTRSSVDARVRESVVEMANELDEERQKCVQLELRVKEARLGKEETDQLKHSFMLDCVNVTKKLEQKVQHVMQEVEQTIVGFKGRVDAVSESVRNASMVMRRSIVREDSLKGFMEQNVMILCDFEAEYCRAMQLWEERMENLRICVKEECRTEFDRESTAAEENARTAFEEIRKQFSIRWEEEKKKMENEKNLFFDNEKKRWVEKQRSLESSVSLYAKMVEDLQHENLELRRKVQIFPSSPSFPGVIGDGSKLDDGREDKKVNEDECEIEEELGEGGSESDSVSSRSGQLGGHHHVLQLSSAYLLAGSRK